MTINWSRSLTSEVEAQICQTASERCVEYLQSMHDGNGTSLCSTPEDIRRTHDVQATLILNAIDKHEDPSLRFISAESIPDRYIYTHGATAAIVRNAIASLDAIGLLNVSMQSNEDISFKASSTLIQQNADLPEERVNWDYSRHIDVHKWSDHQEVNSFVDQIYIDHFQQEAGQENIKKKHLKLVLLDLYVAWLIDPNLKVSFSRNETDYRAGSRYNELNISRNIIKVIDVLAKPSVGLVYQKLGFNDRVSNQSRASRVYPTAKLVAKFGDARFGPLDVESHPNRECIILRDDDKNERDYEDNDQITQMRRTLKAYNELIRSTFVDIPTLANNWIDLATTPSTFSDKHYVVQNDKFVRRIFNRSSFEKGGRFYGGWWQNCPKEWRGKIFLDDQPTSEFDYSGLHMVLLYAEQGINYWQDICEDPYTIPAPSFIDDAGTLRGICKQLCLVSLNAKDEQAAFKAFRRQSPSGSRQKSFTNPELGQLLSALRERHTRIADQFASDAGIRLMNIDGQITNLIIQQFTEEEIPILTIHDSYIVPWGFETKLVNVMQTAFESVTGISGILLTEETDDPLRFRVVDISDPQRPERDRQHREEINARFNPERTERYNHLWNEFRERFNKPHSPIWIEDISPRP